MGQSTIKNNRRIFTTAGGDPTLPDRVTYLENNEYKILYFQTISAATGTITKPTNSTILLDQFYEGGDAIVETLVNGQPSGQSPLTAGGAVVSVSSFDTSGNFTLSGTPTSFDVALVYILKIKAEDYQNLTIANIMAMEDLNPVTQTITNGDTSHAPSSDAVFDALATKQNTLTNPVTGTGTSNEIAYWSASNTIGSLAVATYPNLTELSYVKGLTSAVQTQFSDIRRSYQIITGTLAPADSTTYYSNATSDTSANWSTNIAVYQSQIPITGTIKECSIIVFNNNNPTSEASTLILRNLTTSTDYTLSNGVTFDSTNGVWKPLTIITGLNIPISAGNNFVLKLTTPAWSTNPTSIRIAVNLSISL